MLSKLKGIWTKLDAKPVYQKLGGRSWILISFFALTAFYLEYVGKLTGSYAAVISSLSGFHVGRSIATDYHERKMDGK